MKGISVLSQQQRAGCGVAILAASLYAASIVFVAGADTKPAHNNTAHATAVKTSSANLNRQDPKADPKADPKPDSQLTGSELYSMNCSRCHTERYPTEFTPGQWKTIMLEMRVRANLPAKQARKILKYLQENSGS